jgi:hypothetical protein
MLRLFVLLLVLANSLYFAWSQGMLRAYGWSPAEQSESQRLAQQIRPEAIRVLNADEARRVEIAALAPARAPECLQAGLFSDAQMEGVRRALENSLPAGAWVIDAVVEPARWIIYMGRYPNADALAKKRGELLKLNFRPEPLQNPALELGLSVGNFETQSEATKELAILQKRGLRTARVVQERAETRGAMLRIPAADDAIRAKLDDVKTAIGDKTLKTCGK